MASTSSSFRNRGRARDFLPREVVRAARRPSAPAARSVIGRGCSGVSRPLMPALCPAARTPVLATREDDSSAGVHLGGGVVLYRQQVPLLYRGEGERLVPDVLEEDSQAVRFDRHNDAASPLPVT